LDSQSATVAKAHLDKAKRALDARDMREARTQLELALEADPGLAEAYLILGVVEFQSNENAQAVSTLRRAVELLPNSFSAHYNLALAYLRERKLPEGLRELERAAQLDPKNADAAYNLGLALLELGRVQESSQHLRDAQALGSNRPDIAFNLVRAELAANQFNEARREADSAAKTFGSDPGWRAAVGQLFLEHGQPREAAAHLEEALRIRPDSAQFRRLLAKARLGSQDPEGALAVLKSPESAEDHYLKASAYYLLHRLTEADQESRRALDTKPGEPSYLLLLARIDQRLGQHNEALELLHRTSEQASQWSEPYYSAGVSYYLLRHYEDARRSLDRALELDPGSARSLFLYAASLVNEGKNREAEEYLRRAIYLEPANARFHYHLGALLLRDNRPAEAQRDFEEAVRLKPDFALPHYQLGKLLVRSNHPDLAPRELETAVQYQPDLAQAYYQLSRAYALLGEAEKSARALATFNNLKKVEADEAQELTDEVKEQLELPLPKPR